MLEKSVANGTLQNTGTPKVPSSVVLEMSGGQFKILGGTASTINQTKLQIDFYVDYMIE